MKNRSLFIALALAGELIARPLVPPSSDHLTPVDSKNNGKYRKILTEKLAVSPFNYGRVMLLPTSDAETCESVYSVSRGRRHVYYVTSTSAARSLWHSTDWARHPENAASIRIDRIDAEIPETAAKLIREVWLRMLSGPNGPRPIPPPQGILGLDVPHAEFSLERQNAPPLMGDLDFLLSFPGKRTKQLVDIWNALHEYTKATAEKRPGIAAQIERRARALLEQLKQ